MPNINRLNKPDIEEYRGAEGTGIGKSLPELEMEEFTPWDERKGLDVPGSPGSIHKDPKMRGFLREFWPTMRTYQPTGRTNYSIERINPEYSPEQRMAIMELLRILGAI